MDVDTGPVTTSLGKRGASEIAEDLPGGTTPKVSPIAAPSATMASLSKDDAAPGDEAEKKFQEGREKEKVLENQVKNRSVSPHP